ncbi:hypothetical protein CF319_g3592 [Tilletia indica]|nr:hypothetical protein CF319_g3592 [Tilletia indica]
MIRRSAASSAKALSRCISASSIAGSSRAAASASICPCHRAIITLRTHTRHSSSLAQGSSAPASRQHDEDDGDELPWFMQEQDTTSAAPPPTTFTPATPSQLPPPDIVARPAHLSRTSQLQDLHSLLSTGPLANLVARPSDLAIYDPDADDEVEATADPAAEHPIIYLPTAAIAAALPPHEGAGVAYTDWVILIRARTSAGGALGRLALEVGEYLKRTRPPLSRARSRLEKVEREGGGGSHLGADLFGIKEEGNDVGASQEEFAELVIALRAWARKFDLPSPLPPSELESGEALGLFGAEGDGENSGFPLVNPVSSLRSARIRRTYRPAPITTITSSESPNEGEDLVSLGPRPTGWSRIEWEAGRRLPAWGVQKEALRRKLLQKAAGEEGSATRTAKPFWRPGKILSRSAQDGIRTLHAYDPKNRFSAPELSRAFGISVESVRRILRAGGSRWRASEVEDETGGNETEAQRQLRTSTPLAGLSESGAELEIGSGPTSHVPSWLQRENELAEARGEDGETVEQRQERRAKERRVERVQKIVERISRERAAMDEDEDVEEDIVLDRVREAGVAEHLDREDYETQRLQRRLARRSGSQRLSSVVPTVSSEINTHSAEPQREEMGAEWSQPIHYEGLSPAQSTTLSASNTPVAPASNRPAFQSSRAALPTRANRAAKGDGDGNWVIVDAGWVVVHVLSESGWEKYGPQGGVGSVWREWMGMVERERGWGVEEGMKGKKGAGNEVLAQAFGLGEKKGRKRKVVGVAASSSSSSAVPGVSAGGGRSAEAEEDSDLLFRK